MGIEIERKFLVLNDSWRENVQDCTVYTQAYLSKDPERTVRLRVAGTAAFITIKGRAPDDAPLETPEFEYAVPRAEAEKMLALCLPGEISKTRHKVKHAGHVWEIDVFHGENEGLVVAEIELPAADATFEKPAWLGAEVTHDSRYKNANLSEKPFKTWPKPS